MYAHQFLQEAGSLNVVWSACWIVGENTKGDNSKKRWQLSSVSQDKIEFEDIERDKTPVD